VEAREYYNFRVVGREENAVWKTAQDCLANRGVNHWKLERVTFDGGKGGIYDTDKFAC